jgi:hypothetical protein
VVTLSEERHQFPDPQAEGRARLREMMNRRTRQRIQGHVYSQPTHAVYRQQLGQQQFAGFTEDGEKVRNVSTNNCMLIMVTIVNIARIICIITMYR